MVEEGKALCVPGNHDIRLRRALQGKKVQPTHGLAASGRHSPGRGRGQGRRGGLFTGKLANPVRTWSNAISVPIATTAGPSAP